MLFFENDLLKQYSTHDCLSSLLKATSSEDDCAFTSHSWLLDSLPKRMIYWYVYADLLEPKKEKKKVLDVGGGYCGLTKLLIENHDYKLLDIMAHDDKQSFLNLEANLGNNFWINNDWYTYDIDEYYDIIIANDIFPNVDQRLSLFIDKYLPFTTEMRLTLTYYNKPRWYRVKRTDGDEIFHMLAFDGYQTAKTLEAYSDNISNPNLERLLVSEPSIFENGRHVCKVDIKGSVVI